MGGRKYRKSRSLDMTRRSSRDALEDQPSDEEYNEEADKLFVFPPQKYRKGDFPMSVLMSG